MSALTNPILKAPSISNTSFIASFHNPSIFISKPLHSPIASNSTKQPTSLSLSSSHFPYFSLRKSIFSSTVVAYVAQTSDWGQDAVVEEGSDQEGFVEPPEEAKLYVGNLPFDIDSERLAQMFEGAGVVEISEVIYNRETDRSRGFGFVTMSTVEEAEKAVEMFDRYDLNGRLLVVNKAAPRGSRPEKPPREYQPSFKIYVGNLPWGVDRTRLEQVFSEHGKVLNAIVMSDRETGRPRGFGFVTMATEAEMNDAIAALDGQSLDGRAIRVNAAEERPRRNF